MFWVRVGAIDLHTYHTYINIDIDIYNIERYIHIIHTYYKYTYILYIHVILYIHT